jgi:hypothetical protein
VLAELVREDRAQLAVAEEDEGLARDGDLVRVGGSSGLGAGPTLRQMSAHTGLLGG